MQKSALLIVAMVVTFAGPSQAGNKEVQYAELPKWVVPVPQPTESKVAEGTAFRIVYSDNQIHFGPDGIESFEAYRLKIVRPEALAAGNISLSWSPDAGEAKVHYVRIIRGAETIDVLKSTEFQVLQREGFLEQSALNGELTAALQAPGLQVGDEIEVAMTVRRKDPTLGDHLFGVAALPPTGAPGVFRIRMTWPAARNLHWHASADVTGTSLTTENGQTQLVYELRDPRAVVIADGAPGRVNVRRLLEVSDFEKWSEVSERIWPLFEKAAVLASDSPVRKEVIRIAAADTDPVKRMAAALQLVQDRIRYVYIGLNGGNLTPANADETWNRRFGDCKAKTALLLAVLKELGIRGEAVLVNSLGGDGIDERLPTPAVFDHVVVRVSLENKTYWLDGTRLGDRSLDTPFMFRRVLPVRARGADLESLPIRHPSSPDAILVTDIDATSGFDQKAIITLQQVMRGDLALQLRASLVALSAEDADRAIKAYWRQTNGWVEADSTEWGYNERRGTLVLTLTGKGKLDWSGDETDGRSLDIPGAGFTPPSEYRRPKEQDQQAPWLIEYPRYRCWVTAIHLPPTDSKWKWDYLSDVMATQMGGVNYWRLSDLRNGVMRTVMSRRYAVPEISAAEAEEVNKRLPTFNNKISRVYQIPSGGTPSKHIQLPGAPFGANGDWTNPVTPCGPTEWPPGG